MSDELQGLFLDLERAMRTLSERSFVSEYYCTWCMSDRLAGGTRGVEHEETCVYRRVSDRLTRRQKYLAYTEQQIHEKVVLPLVKDRLGVDLEPSGPHIFKMDDEK